MRGWASAETTYLELSLGDGRGNSTTPEARKSRWNPSLRRCNSWWTSNHPPRSHVMNASQSTSQQATGYELRFRPLSVEGRVQAFPCDAEGHVDIDALSERTRIQYFYARTVIG